MLLSVVPSLSSLLQQFKHSHILSVTVPSKPHLNPSPWQTSDVEVIEKGAFVLKGKVVVGIGDGPFVAGGSIGDAVDGLNVGCLVGS